MGMEVLVASAIMAASTLASSMFAPSAPPMDITNYGLLEQTQKQAAIDSEDALARTDEARRREALRQSLVDEDNILTSDTGALSLDVEDRVLGA